ncbi:hypothetical protein [Streptomyces sp. NPDC088183]|uniref:hypothetical protein n=1 Tax=Streptomyces sp. NPDC088183 TaxID=3160992 RepID=UPI003439B1E3
MSERRDPRSFLVSALIELGYSEGVAEECVRHALDAHAHELAEKQRAEKILPPVDEVEEHVNHVINHLADFIDPEVEK